MANHGRGGIAFQSLTASSLATGQSITQQDMLMSPKVMMDSFM
jgi:hypothetical protein